jgi:hypothetical protein
VSALVGNGQLKAGRKAANSHRARRYGWGKGPPSAEGGEAAVINTCTVSPGARAGDGHFVSVLPLPARRSCSAFHCDPFSAGRIPSTSLWWLTASRG